MNTTELQAIARKHITQEMVAENGFDSIEEWFEYGDDDEIIEALYMVGVDCYETTSEESYEYIREMERERAKHTI